MKPVSIPAAIILLFVFTTCVAAQRPEITVRINEQFFDAAIDAVLQKGDPPSHELRPGAKGDSECNETIRLSRETNGVRTAVRFRDGKILAPIAFDGNYRLPIVGCIGIRGWAQTVVDLEFDSANQRIVARAKVSDVSLNGTAGVGRSLISRMVQSAIDERFDPLLIIGTDRFTFGFPLQPGGNLQIKAVAARHIVRNGSIDIYIAYEFDRN